MTAPIRHGAIGLIVGGPCCWPRSRAARGRVRAGARLADARITTTYVMTGRIVTAVRVRGEHRGQSITRRWTFTGLGCAGSVCRRLRVRRQRGANRFDRVTLSRVGVGSYTGGGRFSSALQCQGRRYPHGLVVPYTIRVQVTRVGLHRGHRVRQPPQRRLHEPAAHRSQPGAPSAPATTPHGTPAWPSRCPPPAAAFLVAAQPADDSATFTDTSVAGAGGAPIVSRVWRFGDPGSGTADNAATASPAGHTFSGPGVYAVTLTVTDANGLSATTTQPVTAPGAAHGGVHRHARGHVADLRLQRHLTAGGRRCGGRRVVLELRRPGSPANLSALQNPQHTFSAPGTYQVCLLATDANGRKAGHCAPVAVPAGATANTATPATSIVARDRAVINPRSGPSPAPR